jgi:hypothetical protein
MDSLVDVLQIQLANALLQILAVESIPLSIHHLGHVPPTACEQVR